MSEMIEAIKNGPIDGFPKPEWVVEELESLEARLAEAERKLAGRAEIIDQLGRSLSVAELTLRSISLNSCCGDCQEAKRVAKAYFEPAESRP